MAGLPTTAETSLTDALPPGHDHPLPGTRAWFVVFVAWMGGLAAVSMWAFAAFEAGSAAAQGVWLLALLCFYLSLCNAFCPLPTAWIILFAASPEVHVVEAPLLRIVIVAVLGALATMMANLNEYHVLALLFRRGLGQRVRRTGVYQWAIRWFDKAPFGTLTLIGFVPIPIDAIRWLAILRHYSRVRFALAYFIGRGGRYVIFAALSVLLALGALEILLVQAGVIVLALAGRIAWRWCSRADARDAAVTPASHR
jgi:membrane protein YqaA with SNARE-associated domain